MIYIEFSDMRSDSSITISSRIPSLFTDYNSEKYPDFVEFISSYYYSQEYLYGSMDLLNNLVDYYNIGNYKLNSLVADTELISDNNTNLIVRSTKGFPKSGFLKIKDEYIYYNSKNSTTFLNCNRGAVATEMIDDRLVYGSSIRVVHSSGKKVINLAYSTSRYILDQFAYNYLSNLPKKLNNNVDYNLLIKNVKSFYLAKGTENSLKFLFRIVYNNNTTHITIKSRGSGAVIAVSVDNGAIITATIINGGTGYSDDPVYHPKVEVVGKGTGAKIQVDTVVGGVITAISLLNGGSLYDNSNNIFINEKDFVVNNKVYGSISKASGVIDYWNPDTKELYISDVSGVFSTNESIVDGVATGVVKTSNIVFDDPTVTLPYENTIKPSTNLDNIYTELILELVDDVTNLNTIDNINILQNAVGVVPIDTAISEINYIKNYDKKLVRVVVDRNTNFYQPPTTRIVSTTNNRIVVDSTLGFLNSGILLIGGEYISYKRKSINEFFGITRNVISLPNHTIVVGDIIRLYGGYKNDILYNFNVTLYNDNIKVYARLVGVMNEPMIIDGSSGYQGTTFLGTAQKKYSDPIKKNWGNISQLYDTEEHVYITSNGQPVVNNNTRTSSEQQLIKRIPKNNIIVGDDKTNSSIGVTIDGVEILNYLGEVVNYGKIVSLTVDSFGSDYKLPNKLADIYPYFLINGIQYSNIIKIYGYIVSVDITNLILTNYTRKPKITITRGVGDVTGFGAELECDYDVSGVINGIIVKNPGKWYTEIPTITIIEGGKYLTPLIIPKENTNIVGFIGRSTFTTNELSDDNFDPKLYPNLNIPNTDVYTDIPTVGIPIGGGASLSVTTINGIISSVVVENGGSNYFTPPTITISDTLGTGVVLDVITQAGMIISVDVINGGANYTTNPTITVVSSGSDAMISAKIETWQKDIVFDNQLIDSDGGYVYNNGDLNVLESEIPYTNYYPQYLQSKKATVVVPSNLIIGTIYTDFIVGTSGNDTIFGLGSGSGYSSTDYIRGGGGDDTIYAIDDTGIQPVTDTSAQIIGGGGNDTIIVGTGYADLTGTDNITRGVGEVDNITLFNIILPRYADNVNFIRLGDLEGCYYLTGNDADFANITNFQPQYDRILLYGYPSDYNVTYINGVTNLYHINLDNTQDLVAKITSGVILDLFNFDQFFYDR